MASWQKSLIVVLNGQTEYANQEIETKLRALCSQQPSKWSFNLPWVEYALNSLPSSATGLSPFLLFKVSSHLCFLLVKERSVFLLHTSAHRCFRNWCNAPMKTTAVYSWAANRLSIAALHYNVGQENHRKIHY